MWEYTSKNSYPDISLHDCRIEGIRFENGDIVFEFDDNGFWVGKDHPENPFGEILRTGKAEMRLVSIDPDSFSVNMHEELRIAGGKTITTRNEITLNDFIKKIDSKKWQFEFVDEYYGYHRAMFCGYIVKDKEPYFTDAQIEIHYEESQYYWNKIHEDRTW